MTGIVCDTLECSQAITRLQVARNRILSLCDRLTQLRASAARADLAMKVLLAAALACVTLAGAAFTQIPVWGWIAALVLLAIAATLLTIAGYFLARLLIINGQIAAAEEEMVAAREEFDKAVAEVMANCPSECWGVLDQPLC